MLVERNFEELPFLVAEDSDDDLFLLKKALQGAGITNPVIVAPTGRQAIDYLARTSNRDANEPFPVILFMDLLMPRVDGIEVLRWLRDNSHPPLPIVLHTGVEDDELLQRARDLGASYYLPKGARPEALAEVFRRARAEWEQFHIVPV